MDKTEVSSALIRYIIGVWPVIEGVPNTSNQAYTMSVSLSTSSPATPPTAEQDLRQVSMMVCGLKNLCGDEELIR